MSRRSFRARVGSPRPLAAWLLVAVASASLWSTGQLAPWAVALDLGLLALGFWRRGEPMRWQESSLLLNLGLLAVVGIALQAASRDAPATIPLAHFAALAQALQLLDARPRRSEFLLVVLALFQVVLASNLTDSVAFPALLAVFVFCAAWTLLIHTLHSEAIEGNEEAGLPRALQSGLLRTTLRATALSVALAGVFFVMLPRLRSTAISGAGLGPGFALAGFSDRVALGDLGRIRKDASAVLRVETLEGDPPAREEAYWRGLAFDHFDGRNWSVSQAGREIVPGSPEGGLGFGRAPERWNLRQRIVREPVAAGALFVAGDLRALHGTLRQLERDGNGGLYASRQADERIRYEANSYYGEPSPRRLRADRARAPRGGERYLQLPRLAPEVAALAQQITAGLAHDSDRMQALADHLRSHGRYSDTPPPLPGDPGRSPIEAFLLGEMAGHCEYFASALVVLARSIGLPARLVNGFAGGRTNEIGDFVEVSQSDAHAWVELHFAQAGWVRYDPTPADLRLPAAAELSLRERLRDLASASELWWYQRVVGFDRADQIQVVKWAWLAWQDFRSERSARRAAGGPALELPALPDLSRAALVLGALGIGGLLLAFGQRSRAARGAAPASYAAALALLRRRGLPRGPCVTARHFAREVARARPELAESFGVLTEAYLGERFGGQRSEASRAALLRFRGALRARRARSQSAP